MLQQPSIRQPRAPPQRLSHCNVPMALSRATGAEPLLAANAIPTTQTVSGPPSATQTINTTTNNPTTTQQTSGVTSAQQNSTTTANQRFAGTVPVAPTSTALAAPTNIGISSADILTQQVELNAQITTLRLLLQGALSDQYLLHNSRAVATRQQTTVGFAVSIDPPRQFRHAVAEVRIVMVPNAGEDAPSIMTLLPSEKTYNVAKITSHQNSFGGGVAVAPVSVGVNTGKSKDRLYLAQEADTLALQFPNPIEETKGLDRAWQQSLHDVTKSVLDFGSWGQLSGCPHFKGVDDLGRLSKTIIFGWQFRPVLGQEYVRGGQRQVFAQLALPTSFDHTDFRPTVYIQTRWRAYDPKRQVVGAVYSSSCSLVPDSTGIALVNTPSIYNVGMTDLGAGQVKLTATGNFYSSGVSVLAGANNLTPLTFDGGSVELFGSAHDLLEAGPLTLVGQNGQKVPFGIETRDNAECKIDAGLRAIPNPDGNSRMELILNFGGSYRLPDRQSQRDGLPKPLVLIANQVYGVKESPFSHQRCAGQPDGSKVVCTYQFVAPTSDVRNAQSFLVRDLRWDDLEKGGDVDFYPMFSALATSSTYPPKPDDPALPGAPKPGTTSFFEVSGYDFDKLLPLCVIPPAVATRDRPCLRIWIGNEDRTDDVQFDVITKSVAVLTADKSDLGDAKAIRFLLSGTAPPRFPIDNSWVEWDLALPKADTSKPSPTPGYLRVADSGIVSFVGGDLSTIDPTTVTFETSKLVATYNAEKKSLDVSITTDVTKLPGHKELNAKIKGNPNKTIQLPIDVVKQ